MPVIELSKAEIYDVGLRYQAVGAPARLTRLVRNKEGEPALDKAPPQMSQKWVNRAGSVVYVTMANGPGLQPTNTPYWHSKQETLVNNQAMPYGQCPFHSRAGQMWMPKEMRERQDPCDPLEFGKGREFGEHRACSHIEEIIALRQGNHTRAEELYAERRKSFAEREAERRALRDEAILTRMTANEAGDDPTALLKSIATNPDLMQLLHKLSNDGQEQRVQVPENAEEILGDDGE